MTSPVYAAALNHKPLTREAERVLFTEYAKLRAKHGASHRKTIAVRNQVIRSYLRLVAKIGKRYRGMPPEDLLGVGVMGLITACERFEVQRGYRFGTYATNWIRHEMGRACENLSSAVRVPVGEQAKRQRGVVGKWDGVAMSGARLSFDAPLTADSESSLYDLHVDADAVSAEAELGSFGTALGVWKTVVAVLDEREREVIESRFLRDRKETLESVGKRLSGGVTREWVRVIQNSALAKMRRHLELAGQGVDL